MEESSIPLVVHDGMVRDHSYYSPHGLTPVGCCGAVIYETMDRFNEDNLGIVMYFGPLSDHVNIKEGPNSEIDMLPLSDDIVMYIRRRTVMGVSRNAL